jgi:hypothetical protein
MHDEKKITIGEILLILLGCSALGAVAYFFIFFKDFNPQHEQAFTLEEVADESSLSDPSRIIDEAGDAPREILPDTELSEPMDEVANEPQETSFDTTVPDEESTEAPDATNDFAQIRETHTPDLIACNRGVYALDSSDPVFGSVTFEIFGVRDDACIIRFERESQTAACEIPSVFADRSRFADNPWGILEATFASQENFETFCTGTRLENNSLTIQENTSIVPEN